MSVTFLPWRFTVFLVPTLLLCLDPRTPTSRAARALPALGGAIAVGLTLFTAQSTARTFARFGEQVAGLSEVARRVPAGARVAYLAFGRRTAELRGPALLHFGQWLQAERRAIVDFSFAEFFPEVVRYRPGQSSGWPPGAEWEPHVADFPSRRGDRYDYFLVCSDRPRADEVYRGAPGPGALVAQSGWFWLYSAASRPSEPSSTTVTTQLSPAAARRTPALPERADVPASR